MLVEFLTVRSSLKESYEKDVAVDINGINSVPFENEEDYLAPITIDMTDIQEFVSGKTYLNGEEKDCIYALRYNGEGMTPALLTSYEEFKVIFKLATGKKVFKTEELL